MKSGVYVVVDPTKLVAPRTVHDVAAAALQGGAVAIQLRDKVGSAREILAQADTLRRLCRRHDALFIVNDRVDLALAADADGVHLGPHDLSVADARRIAPHLLIGASAGTLDAAIEAQRAGADYLGAGAVFDASSSKPDAVHDRGVDAIRDIVEAVDLPVVAIGGITLENAAQAWSTGATALAVIRAVGAHPDPARAVRLLAAARG